MRNKRWILILVMAPVMWVCFQLVLSADRLHAWQYNGELDRPTAADYTRAAVTFWGALLTPVVVGLVAAVVAFCRKYTPRWGVLEMAIIAFPYLVYATLCLAKVFWGNAIYKLSLDEDVFTYVFVGVTLLVGGAVVVSLLNSGACVRHRKWGKLALSALLFCAGVFYHWGVYVFIIYVDT